MKHGKYAKKMKRSNQQADIILIDDAQTTENSTEKNTTRCMENNLRLLQQYQLMTLPNANYYHSYTLTHEDQPALFYMFYLLITNKLFHAANFDNLIKHKNIFFKNEGFNYIWKKIYTTHPLGFKQQHFDQIIRLGMEDEKLSHYSIPAYVYEHIISDVSESSDLADKKKPFEPKNDTHSKTDDVKNTLKRYLNRSKDGGSIQKREFDVDTSSKERISSMVANRAKNIMKPHSEQESTMPTKQPARKISAHEHKEAETIKYMAEQQQLMFNNLFPVLTEKDLTEAARKTKKLHMNHESRKIMEKVSTSIPNIISDKAVPQPVNFSVAGLSIFQGSTEPAKKANCSDTVSSKKMAISFVIN